MVATKSKGSKGSAASSTIAEHLRQKVGEKVVFLCARHTYWGVLSEVNEKFVVLANAVAVEQSGPANGESPTTSDPIFSSITIFNDAMELMMQPRWSQGELPSEG